MRMLDWTVLRKRQICDHRVDLSIFTSAPNQNCDTYLQKQNPSPKQSRSKSSSNKSINFTDHPCSRTCLQYGSCLIHTGGPRYLGGGRRGCVGVRRRRGIVGGLLRPQGSGGLSGLGSVGAAWKSELQGKPQQIPRSLRGTFAETFWKTTQLCAELCAELFLNFFWTICGTFFELFLNFWGVKSSKKNQK